MLECSPVTPPRRSPYLERRVYVVPGRVTQVFIQPVCARATELVTLGAHEARRVVAAEFVGRA